jgi:HK97 family phage prohead protease
MTTDLLTRAFDVSDLDLAVRAKGAGSDGRTVYGIAVPYNAPQYIHDGLTEEFVRGVFSHQLKAAHRVRAAREHVQLGGVMVGACRVLEERDEGLYFEARVSNTASGNDTLELIRDGALRQVSIGFRERPGGSVRTNTGSIQRTGADLFEIAFVMEGAYGELAELAGVRSAGGAHIDPRVAAVHGCTCCRELEQVRALQSQQQATLLTLPALPALPRLP